MEAAHEYRMLMACDIAAPSGRTEQDRLEIRQFLESACRGAFHAGGMDWDSCTRWNTTDGCRLVVPSGFRKRTLLDRVLPGLTALLLSYNEWAAEHLRIRLRVALHADEIHRDSHGSASNTPFEILLCLLNATLLRTAIADAPNNVPIAAIFSQRYGEEIAGCDKYESGTDAFIPVEIREKEYNGRAWIHYPGSREVPRP
ncbi:hypothetical protein [Catenulispora pinisilvae]|uniref:hypothetical protein n=1 Tax=Catenulispora pinisilvae TaxID=2705253 RepID=UPI001891CD7A|nr:hypothetical protein [Catenulispora pinisilvae]